MCSLFPISHRILNNSIALFSLFLRKGTLTVHCKLFISINRRRRWVPEQSRGDEALRDIYIKSSFTSGIPVEADRRQILMAVHPNSVSSRGAEIDLQGVESMQSILKSTRRTAAPAVASIEGPNSTELDISDATRRVFLFPFEHYLTFEIRSFHDMARSV